MSQSFDLSGNSVVERFLRYVRIHTTSVDNAECYPSSERQKDLCRLLVQELQALGLTDAAMDENGYVMATLPANVPPEEADEIGAALPSAPFTTKSATPCSSGPRPAPAVVQSRGEIIGAKASMCG